jgi:dihydropteroate synthase
MGVVNVTPDSFSDGGRWFRAQDAIDHGLALVASGADIVDVGGESTRPGAPRVSQAEELRRTPCGQPWPSWRLTRVPGWSTT